MEFINLTPHAIRVQYDNGTTVTFEPSGTAATVATVQEWAYPAGAFPCTTRTFGEVQGLPAAREGVTLIVSSMVLDRCQGRDDVVAPDTGSSAIREKGQVWAVKGFVRPAPVADIAANVHTLMVAAWNAGSSNNPGVQHQPREQALAEIRGWLGV